MLRAMAKLPSISFVGAGALASGVSRRLYEAGLRIDEIIVRDSRGSKSRKSLAGKSLARGRTLAKKVGAKAVSFKDAAFAADLIWFAVSDSAIAECALAAARKRDWRKSVVLHSSGALTSDELAPLRKRGASCASLHPMMTFVQNEAPDLNGVAFAVEGDRGAVTVAGEIVKRLGGRLFAVKKNAKPLYHAFGAFLSPLLVAQLTAAEEVAEAAGIPRSALAQAMAPILLRTLENYFAEGGPKAFSGPLARGDVETIRRHVLALGTRPAAEVYRALARYAVAKLPVKNRGELKKVLQGEPLE